MRGLAETRPLEEFPVSLLKIEQRSSPKLDVPLLERIATRRLVRPTVFEASRSPAPPTTGRIIQGETEVLQKSGEWRAA